MSMLFPYGYASGARCKTALDLSVPTTYIWCEIIMIIIIIKTNKNKKEVTFSDKSSNLYCLNFGVLVDKNFLKSVPKRH